MECNSPTTMRAAASERKTAICCGSLIGPTCSKSCCAARCLSCESIRGVRNWYPTKRSNRAFIIPDRDPGRTGGSRPRNAGLEPRLLANVGRQFAVCARRILVAEWRGIDRLAHQALEIGSGQRPAEMKALVFIAAGGLQEVELLRCFDAFGDHLEVQTVGQGNNCANDRCVLRAAHDFVDEDSVDLQFVDR